MDALTAGSMLGPYELLVRLGRGGMASVWVARETHDEDQRLLAVKAMLPELARNPDFRSMFLEEGQIIRSIDHPNVVKVHDVGEENGILYMGMEWVEGDSLRALIQEARRRRPIPPEIAVKLIADAAAGLHAAHELRGWDGELRNVVHCDVSPHNILVGIDGRAKIVDFGVANASLHEDLAAEEKIKGKFSYMSPEQAEGRRIDRRSDVFALGIVLFELTTGERLFRGESQAHTLALVTSGKIPDPRDVHPDYPERLARIVRRALARDPNERFQTAEALREALDRYLVEERTLVSPGSVAQLVRRVLGTRIEQLRQNLRETLLVRDGVLRAELVPDSPTAIGTFTGVLPLVNPPGYSGTPRPAAYEPPPPARSALPPLFAAVGGIAAAVSSIVWVMNRPGPMTLVTSREPQRANPTAPAEPRARAAAVDDGIDVDSIPLGGPSARPSSSHLVRSARRAPRRSTASSQERVQLEESSDFREPSPGAPSPHSRTNAVAAISERAPGDEGPVPEQVHLEETPSPAAVASQPKPVQETEPSAPGPFNRGAALAQLGFSSTRAAQCAQPNGVTGAGHATITFSPNGRAAKVVVSPPFAGTPVGSCVTGAFQSARIPVFTGSPVTLPWSFRVKP